MPPPAGTGRPRGHPLPELLIGALPHPPGPGGLVHPQPHRPGEQRRQPWVVAFHAGQHKVFRGGGALHQKGCGLLGGAWVGVKAAGVRLGKEAVLNVQEFPAQALGQGPAQGAFPAAVEPAQNHALLHSPAAFRGLLAANWAASHSQPSSSWSISSAEPIITWWVHRFG